MDIQLIDKNALSAKERRKLKREEKKSMELERKELLAKLGAAEPAKRMSIFGSMYAESVETQWLYYDPLGWVHATEQASFFRYYAQCSVDKTWHKSDELLRLANGEFISAKNSKDKYEICAYSNYAIEKENMMDVYMDRNTKGRVWKRMVEENFKKCEVTNRLYTSPNITRITHGKVYNWVNRWLVDGKNFTKCPSCHKVYEPGNVIVRPGSSSMFCSPCHTVATVGTIIHPHDYNHYPDPIRATKEGRKIVRMVGGRAKQDGPWTFYTGSREMEMVNDHEYRLFGVEAETELSKKGCSKDCLTRVNIAIDTIKYLGEDFVVVKEDGTLTANAHYSKGSGYAGFEIVTCPAALSVHRERWPRLDEEFRKKYLRAWDEYDTCGLHIHVSRECLTEFQIGRMLMFINHKNNAKFIFKVAGRGSERFCRYIPKEPGDKTHPAADVFHPETKVINVHEEGGRNRGRRVALNLSNKATVEFRIFRGTVHPRHIIRNLEFCDATCDFCAPAERSVTEMANYKKFIDFVSVNRKRWPILAEWMANQKVIALKEMGAKADKDKATLKPENSVESELKNLSKEDRPEEQAEFDDLPQVPKSSKVTPLDSFSMSFEPPPGLGVVHSGLTFIAAKQRARKPEVACDWGNSMPMPTDPLSFDDE